MNRAGRPHKDNGDMNLGGVMQTFGGFLDLLTKLADADTTLERSGEVADESGRVRAVYGLSVRVGGGGAPRVEPFGNVKVGASGPKVEETREPLVDIFDETNFILVVAELPGVSVDYRKELLLPAAVDAERTTSSYRNGILEINLPKKSG
jgi:HSP20 family protein